MKGQIMEARGREGEMMRDPTSVALKQDWWAFQRHVAKLLQVALLYALADRSHPCVRECSQSGFEARMQGTTEETAASSWYTACVASSSVLNTHPALCLLQRALQRDTEMHLVGAIETN
ncbi:hypothetical protein KUCAC02_016511 [Chaenocephalus aceratus]|nr:hypothetical protein KUCAC02_016511 [Chaenocephalus aceratus]